MSLSVKATGEPTVVTPSVQVVFVVETTLYDGVYDTIPGASGVDNPCDGPCDESNAVPFFTANAGTIASDIAEERGANLTSCAPGAQSTICFAMVDYFSTLTDHDDGLGQVYHVDVSSFAPASEFQSQVTDTFQAELLGGGYVLSESDFSENILDSSSITALFGAETRAGSEGWNSADRHVIVWMGSTAPRDTNYSEDYAVSHSDYNTGNSSGCEPPYEPKQPDCLGWVGTNDSVASVAKSIYITIDTIDLATGVTMLGSGDYTNEGPVAQQDVSNILSAGCDLAVATGGSWEGPAPAAAGIPFSCAAGPAGSGGQGNLTCVNGSSCEAAGAEFDPARNWSSNAPLGWALTHIDLPSPSAALENVSAYGTDQDLINFIPAQGFEVDPTNPSYQVNCQSGPTSPPLAGVCSNMPQFNGLGPLGNGIGWSWPSATMYLGDTFNASFNVVADASFPTGDLNESVILDACVGAPTNPWSSACHAFLGVGPDLYTDLEYDPFSTPSTLLSPPQSFPPAWVTVESGAALSVFASATPLVGIAPLPVHLSSEISGGLGAFAVVWDLGDGSTGSGQNVTHTYLGVGEYDATVNVTDGVPGDYSTATVVIRALPPLTAYLNVSMGGIPVANGSWLPQGGTLTLESGSSGGAPPATGWWTINGTSQSPPAGWTNLTLARPGNFTVMVSYIDSLGDLVSAGEGFHVLAVPVSHPPPVPLVVTLSANRTSLSLGGTVALTTDVESGQAPFRFTWQLDGSNLTYVGSQLTVQFLVAGVHTVIVYVADATSNFTSNAVSITVDAPGLSPPPPSPSPSPTPPTVEPTVTKGGSTGTWGAALLAIALLSVPALFAWALLAGEACRRGRNPPPPVSATRPAWPRPPRPSDLW